MGGGGSGLDAESSPAAALGTYEQPRSDEARKSLPPAWPPPEGTGRLDRPALPFGQKQRGVRRGALHHPSRHGNPLTKAGVRSGLYRFLRFHGSNRTNSDEPIRT